MGNNMPSFGLRATGSRLRASQIDTRRRMSRVLQVFPRSLLARARALSPRASSFPEQDHRSSTRRKETRKKLLGLRAVEKRLKYFIIMLK